MDKELQQRSSSSRSKSCRQNSITPSKFGTSPNFSRPPPSKQQQVQQPQVPPNFSRPLPSKQQQVQQPPVPPNFSRPLPSKQQQVQQPQAPPNFSRPLPSKQQQVQQPPVPPNFSRPLPSKQQQVQQPQQARAPIRPPQKEAELLLKMDYTAREQAIRDLRQQRRPEFVNLIIKNLAELDRQQAVIGGLKGNIPSQAPQQEQPSETRMERIKTRIAKPFDATKEPRKEVAAGMRQHEAYSDQTKILGQDSTHTNIDRIGLQNLPAN